MTFRRSSPRAKPRWALAITGIIALLLGAVGVALAIPSNFVEVATDFNLRHNGAGTLDWANSGPNRTITSGVVSVNGTGGIWDGGVLSGSNNIPPTPPQKTAGATANAQIIDAEFIVDPLSSDNTACGSSADPTSFAGAGSETNGGLLSSFTWGNAGNTPPKNDLSNVYAISRDGEGRSEIFFGAERVVNNGDSHIDFEFLQDDITLTGTNVPCGPGGFSGDRTQGDFLLAIDFTKGGEFGGATLYRWQCDTVYDPSKDGDVCNPPANGQSIPHYEPVTDATVSQALVFGVNSGETPIAGGGWVHRNSDGSPRDDVIKNAFMEGAIDLGALGFDGCVQTLLPHTRSSQSFTAVLKDFALVSFDTCREPGITTQVKDTNGTAALTTDDTNVADGATITPGRTLYDTSTLVGSTASAGGTVEYFYRQQTAGATTPDCTSGTSLGSKTVTNAAVPASDTVTLNTPGTYEFWAVYSGDLKNNGATSTCGTETVVVPPNSPTIATQVKNTNGTATTTDDTNVADGGSVPIGTSVYDTSSLSGATSDAGGTVSYYYKKQASGVTDDCTAGTLIGSAVTVTNGSIPASSTVTLSSAGTYEFWAVYTGDDNNNGATSTCGTETVVVPKNSPTIPTQVKNTNGTTTTTDDTNVADGGSVPIGTTVYDTATLSGATSDAGGSVEYFYKQQAAGATTPDCTSGTSLGSKTVTNGVVPASDTVTLSSAGTYEFWAVYTGDDNNNGATSTCGTETVVVTPNNPTITSQPAAQIRDSATVSGLTSDATGTVTVRLSPPTNSTCDTGGTVSQTTTKTIGTDLTVTSGSVSLTTEYFTVTSNGTWRYVVYYSGDANNTAQTSGCNDETAVITITPTPS